MKEENLIQAWQLFCRLDTTATYSKVSQTRLSRAVILLSLIAAFSVCLAQIHAFISFKEKFTIVAAIVSALSAYATTQIMHSKSEKSWQNIRSTAELVKSEIYFFCTGFGRYYGLTEDARCDLFYTWFTEVETACEEMDLRPFHSGGPAPDIPLDISQYIQLRVKDQVTWYNAKSKYYTNLLNSFNTIMQGLTLLMLILGILNLFYSSSMWVAFFTTLVSSISAHMMASKYKELRRAYSLSAKQMTHIESDFTKGKITDKDVVEKTEAILRGENKAWQGMW